ncbi:MAG TPA: TetR/AcrR family transcriptional regulator [Actinophytocola sp.]|nr:TetR/AcrR family transcriptional regulator [Actinophytocola sp.]
MSPGESAVAESGARLRTRRAILDAAVGALVGNASATLADIAAAANVGRTTVHRYFPERSDLIDAVSAHLLERIEAATERAKLDAGTAPEALSRLCQEFFEFGDLFTLCFTVPELMAGPAWEEETDGDRALLRLVERGHHEGTIDREMEPRWVQQLLWSLLFSGWSHVRDNGVPKHHALSLCLRSLAKALAP